MFSKIEEEWCLFHNLVQSSLNHVATIYEDVLHTLHRYRPKFLVTSEGLPSYYVPYEFRHTCLLKFEKSENSDALATDDEHLDPVSRTRKCAAVPFVGSNQFQMNEVAGKFATTIKEIRIQYAEDISGGEHNSISGGGSYDSIGAPLCRYFVNGTCNRGSECPFSHSLYAKKPVCMFFFSLKGCRNGDSCFFSHDMAPSSSSCNGSSLCAPEDTKNDASLLLRAIPTYSDGCIVLLDDNDFRFSRHFAHHYDQSCIIATTSLANSSLCDSSPEGIRILWGLSHPYQTIISEVGKSTVPWNEVECVFWSPKFDSDVENLEAQKSLIRTFFEYLAIRVLADALYEVQVILAMNNIRFSLLQMEKLARESFFFLKESFPFDESSFGALIDGMSTKKPMLESKSITYVFNLHPPADTQFRDYKSILYYHLHNLR